VDAFFPETGDIKRRPQVHAGSDDDTNLITLCRACHGLLHNAAWSMDHAELVNAGLAAAKRRGVKLGGYRGGTITKAMHKASAAAVAKRADARAADRRSPSCRRPARRRCGPLPPVSMSAASRQHAAASGARCRCSASLTVPERFGAALLPHR
jgi:hypothetical protein